MHLLVIYNPVSGPRHGLLCISSSALRRELEAAGTSYVWYETAPVEKQPFAQFLEQKFDRILVCGGDGTVREVAQFLATHRLDTPLAVIPQGTGNMVALSLGIPLRPLKRVVTFALITQPQPIDMLLVNKRHYALIGAGQGYDTVFIRGASREQKKRYGFLAYVLSFLRTFFLYRSHRYNLTVDGKRLRTTGKLVVAFNLVSAGGLRVDPATSPQDGKADLLVFNPRSLFDVLHAGLLLLLGRPREHVPRLQAFAGTNISIKQHRGQHIQIDGEVFDETHLHVEVIPKAIRLVYTAKFH